MLTQQIAISLLDELEERKLVPNIRTFNTLLRGCMRNSSAPECRIIFARLEARTTPDATSIEYAIKTLSSELQVDEAWQLSKRHRAKMTAPAWAALAMGAALAGNRKGECAPPCLAV